MGYYSHVYGELKIKSGMTDKLKEAVSKIPDEKEYFNNHAREDITIKDGIITFYESERKWYGFDKLMTFLAPYIEDGHGVTIEGEEQGDVSKYNFYDGKVKKLKGTMVFKKD